MGTGTPDTAVQKRATARNEPLLTEGRATPHVVADAGCPYRAGRPRSIELAVCQLPDASKPWRAEVWSLCLPRTIRGTAVVGM